MKNSIQKASVLALSSVVLLSACGSGAETETPTTDTTNTPPADTTSTPPAETSTKYADGTYSANGTYQSPAGNESISVELTIEEDMVTAVNVEVAAVNETSVMMQELFIEGIEAEVLGKPLDEIELKTAVNGSSLSPAGFMNAVESIKESALNE